MSNYNVIYTGGCDSKLWEIIDMMGVEYKMIYDIDKICKKEKHKNTSNGNNITFSKDNNKLRKFIESQLRIDPQSVLNTDLMEISDFNDWIDAVIRKIQEVTQRIYIFNSKIKDLEGVGKLLYDITKFAKKKEWNIIDTFDLQERIKNNESIFPLKELKDFLIVETKCQLNDSKSVMFRDPIINTEVQHQMDKPTNIQIKDQTSTDEVNQFNIFDEDFLTNTNDISSDHITNKEQVIEV